MFARLLVGCLVTAGLFVPACLPGCAPAGQPAPGIVAAQPPKRMPPPAPPAPPEPPARKSWPCDSAEERTWRAYEDAQDELRWYEFIHSLRFFSGDAVTQKFKDWPEELQARSSKHTAEVMTFALFLHTELEKNQPFKQVPELTLDWERKRARIRAERIAFTEDLFKLVYKTTPSPHMVDIKPLERPE